MRRFSLLILFACSVCAYTHAQSWEFIRSHRDIYLTGEGFAETVAEADEQALRDLISKISTVVESQVTSMADETSSNGDVEGRSYFEAKINTYSQATISNTEKLIISNEPDAHVARYVKRTEIDKIFEGRKNKVHEYVRLALMAESRGKVDDALRNYYWAFTLLKTVQYASQVTYEDENGISHALVTWIPAQIDALFDDLDVHVMAINGSDVDMLFTFRGQPVASLDYTYFDGRDWSNIYSAKNGRGVLELSSGMMPSSVQLKYEYAYRGQTHIDRELEGVMKVVKGRAIRSSYATVDLRRAATSAPAQQAHTPAAETARATTNMPEKTSSAAPTAGLSVVKPTSEQAGVVASVVNAIRSRQYDAALPYFTAEGADMYQRLIRYGKARVLEGSDYTYTQFGDEVIVRSIPMAFSFERGVRHSFVENVVLSINKEGKIDNIAFGLDDQATADIMSKRVWSEEARQTIVTFLENYKTAFALKRIDYIENIFADDAIIIVGHVVKRMEKTGNELNPYTMNRYVQRTQYTKQQYISNLRRCFNAQEFVNIRFANNDVVKAGRGGELYGIQIKQDYYSTTYGDQGYLYLQVDLNDPKLPIIRVRTWQDEPDPELMTADPESTGIYGMQDF